MKFKEGLRLMKVGILGTGGILALAAILAMIGALIAGWYGV